MGNKVEGACFLITGGASLVGSHLTDLLLQAGAREVRLMENFALGTAETIAHLQNEPRVKLIRGDITSSGDFAEACEGVDGLFALAGFLTIPMSKNPALGVEVNCSGVVNTLEAAKKARIGRVVFASSTAVYGNSSNDPLAEDAGFVSAGLTPASMLYSSSKLVGESLCAIYQKNHGVECNVLRFATIYGERQHARAVNANYIAEVHDAVRAGKAPQIPGDGSEVHDYIYVTDAASALMKAYKSRNSGLRLNISSDADSNLVQLVRAVLKACRREDLEPVMVPDTRAVRSYTATSLHFSNKLARETIDWVPSLSLEEGVSLFIRWRENHLERSKEAAT